MSAIVITITIFRKLIKQNRYQITGRLGFFFHNSVHQSIKMNKSKSQNYIDNENNDLIRITHFVNPHNFYYKIDEGFLNEDLMKLENQLRLHGIDWMKKHRDVTEFKPKVGETVGLLHQPWNKYIRVVIDSIAEFMHHENKYILWAIDYGIPLTSTLNWLVPLPIGLANNPLKIVFKGGLSNYLPSQMTFNYNLMKKENEKQKNWSEQSIELVEKVLNDAAIVMFKIDFKLNDNGSDHYFGDLIVKTHFGDDVAISDILETINLAMRSEQFLKDLTELNTINSDRWKDGRGNVKILSGKYNNPTVNSSFKTASSPKSDKVVDCGNDIVEKVRSWTMQNSSLAKKGEKSLKSVPAVTLPSNDESLLRIGGQTQQKRVEMFNKNNLRAPVNLSSPPIVEAYDDWTSVLNVINVPKQNSNKENGTKNNTANNFERFFSELSAGVNTGISKPHGTNFEKRNETPKHNQNKKTNRVAFIPSGYEREVDSFKKYNNEHKLTRSRSFGERKDLESRNNKTDNRYQNRDNVDHRNKNFNNRGNTNYNYNRRSQDNGQGNYAYNRQNSNYNRNPNNRGHRHSDGVVQSHKPKQHVDDDQW